MSFHHREELKAQLLGGGEILHGIANVSEQAYGGDGVVGNRAVALAGEIDGALRQLAGLPVALVIGIETGCAQQGTGLDVGIGRELLRHRGIRQWRNRLRNRWRRRRRHRSR
jgi:hypothetical protein